EKQLDPVKEHVYRYIFNNNFNLQFHPRKDTCKNCDKYKQLINVESDSDKKAQLERDHILHLAKADKARDSLKADGICLLFLLKYIPPVHHNFFRGITGSQDVEDVGPHNPSEEDEVDADEVEEEES
ncbi:hypothetical protein J6590_107566, partial [Homalodisca vitripennis]